MKTTAARGKTSGLKAFLFFEIVTLAAGVIGGLLGGKASISGLIKPPLMPPYFIFPIAWIALALIIGYAAYHIWAARDIDSGRALRLYLLLLLINLLWPLFFFRLGWRLFTFFWILLLIFFGSLVMSTFKKISKPAFFLMIPYFLWLLFTAYLNLGFYLFNA